MAAADPRPSVPAPSASSDERLFPTRSPAQVARVASHGRVRPVQSGEVLLEVSDHLARFFAGHFALDTRGDEVAALVRGFMRTQK